MIGAIIGAMSIWGFLIVLSIKLQGDRIIDALRSKTDKETL
jgi:hypothetical protein